MKAARAPGRAGRASAPCRSRRRAEARVSAVPAGARTGRAANGARRPEERAEAVARWAQEHELPYDDGHVQFPDARIEYEGRDGRRAVEDIEVVTPHYRGAHAAAKARSGFTRYRASGARLGGLRTTGTKRSRRRPAPCRGAAVVTFAERVHAVAEEGIHRPSGGVSGHRHAALRRLRQPPVLRLRSDRPRSEGPRLLCLPGGKDVRHVVLRGASARPHLPRARQAALRRDWRAEQPQPQARHARPRHRAADVARCGACANAVFGGWAAEREKVEYFKAATTPQAEGAAPPGLRYGAPRRPFGTSQTSCRSVSPATVARTCSSTSSTGRRLWTSVPSCTVTRELLRALPQWELRLLVPRHLVEAAPLFEAGGARGVEPAASPGRRGRTALVLQAAGPSRSTVTRPRTSSGFARACRRFQRRRGFTCSIGCGRRTATALHATVSPVLEDEIARRRGHVTSAGAGPCLCPSLTPGWLGIDSRIGANGGGNDRLGRSVPPPGAAARRIRARCDERGCVAASRVSQVVESEASC